MQSSCLNFIFVKKITLFIKNIKIELMYKQIVSIKFFIL